MFMFSSNHDPRFLTAVTGLIVASPKTNPLMSTLAGCCLVPISINYVLLSFTLSLSLIIQHLMALTQRSIASLRHLSVICIGVCARKMSFDDVEELAGIHCE